jgi:hypothetical protein
MNLSVLLITVYLIIYCQQSQHWVYCVIMLYVMNVTVSTSISIGLYPKLDLWTANKLHYITLPATPTKCYHAIWPGAN